jgi:hypothetical protein
MQPDDRDPCPARGGEGRPQPPTAGHLVDSGPEATMAHKKKKKAKKKRKGKKKPTLGNY